MTGTPTPGPRDALDAALAAACAAPPLPEAFLARLHAAVAREPAPRAGATREAVELEWRLMHATLRAAGRRVALTAAGGLAAAVVLPVALVPALVPWIRASFGADAIRMIPIAGVAVGLAIAWAGTVRRLHLDA